MRAETRLLFFIFRVKNMLINEEVDRLFLRRQKKEEETMMELFFGGLWIAILVTIVGAALIGVDHYFKVKRSNALAKFVCDDAIKTWGKELTDMTDKVLDKTFEKSVEMTSKLMGLNN